MLSNLKTMAMLMLVAGLSLGVFAGTLLAGPTEVVSKVSRVDTAIEARMELYKERFDLNEDQTRLVRDELLRYRRLFHQELMGVYQQNQQKFHALMDESTARILSIVDPDGKREGGG